ncbi:MAG: S-layer homology domain-containing protein [Eubacteriales bacterium]|nr:S-layer homology domain-containing protein [Eubacteriales bacterium]
MFVLFSKKGLPRRILRIPVLMMVFVMAFTIFPGITPARAESATTTVDTGNGPTALAVNPVTNKIYAVNKDDSNVTVIDGDDNTIQTVPVGSMPNAAAVNPAANKVYVANVMGQSITVIDGETNTPETIDVGMYVNEFAINTVTNKIYVSSYGGDRVIVLDGADHRITAAIDVGDGPTPLAVNHATNKIYVGNIRNNSVTVIDGATNQTETVNVGDRPIALAVNPVTNKIYVANQGASGVGCSVMVIDGASNTVTGTVNVGYSPSAVAVNPVTNQIYVVNQGTASISDSGSVTVIDGADDTVADTVDVGNSPNALAVNPLVNKIYVTNRNSDSVTVIDGADNTAATIGVGDDPYAVAVNPVTNKIYIANYIGNSVTVIDGAGNHTETIAAGDAPSAAAVNPMTNKIYVSNMVDNSITVIDDTGGTTETVAAGDSPYGLAVNPVTDKIYAANAFSGNVTVINGADNSTEIVDAGDGPFAVAVNPVTNKIYVANYLSNNITVINGADNSTEAAITVGEGPLAVEVNPVTNKIYVANEGSDTVSVVNGADNSTGAAIAVGDRPRALAINPVTNKIYVVNFDSDDVTVIDGADNATTSVSTGCEPSAVAVNAVTNKIYVTTRDDFVTVINGADNSTETVNTGDGPCAVAVNTANNKIYVANGGGNNVTVIDGATNTTETVGAGTEPFAVAASPTTCKVYVPNRESDTVTVISDHAVPSGIMETSIAPLAGNITRDATPSFQLSAERMSGPAAPAVQQIWCRVDSLTGEWEKARPSGSSGSYTSEALALGEHVLYAFATDGRDAGRMGNPVIGSISSYAFTVFPPPPSNSSGRKRTSNSGAPAELTAGAYGESLTITIDTKKGVASARMDASTLDEAFGENGIDSDEAKTVNVKMPEAEGVDDYVLELPASALAMKNPDRKIELETAAGTVTLPGNMLEGTGLEDAGLIGISIGKGDKSSLPGEVKEAIGDRPLIELTFTMDGEKTEWNNPDASVTVKIPYAPSEEELENPESIMIWYVDGSGKAASVTNGQYHPADKTVSFSITHFSHYGIGYNQVSFKDVPETIWYSRAVGFIAARGISTGTGNGCYSPEAKLTRSEFIVMMMRAYEISPDTNPKDNFADAGDTYFTGYLAAAKRLGISDGVGNGMFAPAKKITRQEMFALLYNALKQTDELPEGEGGKTLSSFKDAGQVDSWAKDAVELFAQAGIISGIGDKLSVESTATRAEMAQVLYNLLVK